MIASSFQIKNVGLDAFNLSDNSMVEPGMQLSAITQLNYIEKQK